MLKLTPILLAILYGLVMYRFSVWRTKSELDSKSVPLTDPTLNALMGRMARALDIEQIKVFVYDIDPVNGLAAPE